MRNRVGVLAAVVMAVVGVLATSDVARAGDRDHESGFFMRLSAGGGGAKTEFDMDHQNVELSGTSGDINFAFGGIVAPNLALHGTLFGWAISEPDLEVVGVSFEVPADLTLSAIGAGMTYYFMPVNIYVSGSVGVGIMQIEGNGGEGETDHGIVIDLTVGKEWWVGRNWGLGVAGGFGYHSLPEKNMDENWTGTSFGVRFSATLN